MHKENRNVPDSFHSYDIELECQRLPAILSFARNCTSGIGKIPIFTNFMVYENQAICQHTS